MGRRLQFTQLCTGLNIFHSEQIQKDMSRSHGNDFHSTTLTQSTIQKDKPLIYENFKRKDGIINIREELNAARCCRSNPNVSELQCEVKIILTTGLLDQMVVRPMHCQKNG